MTTKGTDNRFRSLTVVGESGTPATPASGDFKLYVADDGTFYVMDDTGTPTALGGGGGLSDPMTTRGDIIVRNASNVTARLGVGGSGTVLSSDGTDVSWQTPSAGGGSITWLQRLTASTSATLDATSFISSTYNHYMFLLRDILPDTNATMLVMRMGTGGGPSWDTGSNYGFGMIRYNAAGAAGSGTNTGATSIELTNSTDTMSNDATYNGCSGTLYLTTASGTTYPKVYGQIAYKSTNWEAVNNTGIYLVTTTLTGVRFFFNSGNIASGTIDVYGIKHA